MSTEIRNEYGDHRLQLTQYYGGKDTGICIQLTGLNCDGEVGFVGMSVRDAYETAIELVGWIKTVASMRAEKLRDEIAKNKELERTIFSEAAECEHWVRDLRMLDIPLRLLEVTG